MLKTAWHRAQGQAVRGCALFVSVQAFRVCTVRYSRREYNSETHATGGGIAIDGAPDLSEVAPDRTIRSVTRLLMRVNATPSPADNAARHHVCADWCAPVSGMRRLRLELRLDLAPRRMLEAIVARRSYPSLPCPNRQ